MSGNLALSNSTATHEVRELTADELELIAGGGCPEGFTHSTSKSVVKYGILGAAGGALTGPGAGLGLAGGMVGGFIAGTFDCLVD
jgi:hypothetical protein